MDERQLEASVYEYLVHEKSYPKDALQTESAIGRSPDGRSYRADLAILDPIRSEVVALIEVKRVRERAPLRNAVAQLLQYRRILGKPHIPLYLFFPPLSGSGKKFDIAQVLPDGNTKELYLNEFPTFDALISGDKSNEKAAKTAAVRSTVDTFQLTCVLLSIVTTILLALDVSEIVQLNSKQLILACISGGLLVLPFAAKFKMLGVEFERHNPRSEKPDEP